MPNSLTIQKTTYRVGDRVYYVNVYGQQFYGTIARIHGDMLLVQQDGWEFGPHPWNPLDYVRTRHFPKGN